MGEELDTELVGKEGFLHKKWYKTKPETPTTAVDPTAIRAMYPGSRVVSSSVDSSLHKSVVSVSVLSSGHLHSLVIDKILSPRQDPHRSDRPTQV